MCGGKRRRRRRGGRWWGTERNGVFEGVEKVCMTQGKALTGIEVGVEGAEACERGALRIENLFEKHFLAKDDGRTRVVVAKVQHCAHF